MRRVRHRAEWILSYVSADEVACLDLASWIRDGDGVIGKYGAGYLECLASDGGILGD